MMRIPRAILIILLFFYCILGSFSQESGFSVLPESYLRGWDPITVYFSQERGPDRGGPMDGASSTFTITPDWPGEYRWINSTTVQFLPAEAWPPMQSFTVSTAEGSSRLVTMMDPPVSMSPSNGQSRLEPVSVIQLGFSQAVEPSRLSEIISIEVRPLPGLSEGENLWLTGENFEVKALERGSADQPARYRIELDQPIGYGRYAVLHIRLSNDQSIDGSVGEYHFSTRPEFRLSGMGAGSVNYPVAVNGSRYARSQAINCGTASAPLFLEFTEDLGPVSIEQVKEMVHFEPAVDALRHEVRGRRLYLYFEADPERAYTMRVEYAPVESEAGRNLADFGESSLVFFYQQLSPYVRWNTGTAIVERYGAQELPMEGRATEAVDLRVYEIQPTDQQFWPFPARPVSVREQTRPPMPGEEEYATSIQERIRLLGSPEVSRIFELPIDSSSGNTRFGLDLRSVFQEIAGEQAPGTYLCGYRPLSGDAVRNYVRVTVTDLCLSTVEEEHAVNFIVTSLASGEPVSGAEVVVQGYDEGEYITLFSGITSGNGQYRYEHRSRQNYSPQRIIVRLNDDVLILDPDNPPPAFSRNHWYSSSSWLGWITRDPRQAQEEPRTRGWVISERPIYRPDEAVHLFGFVRSRQQGRIIAPEYAVRTLVLRGPGRNEWRYSVELDDYGQF
ncbi:MAG: hypothetical protein ACLFR1_08285, partial [Spirochaetia bacterium]